MQCTSHHHACDCREKYFKEAERKAWIAGVHSADRILKETIKEAMEALSQESFMKWIRGFVAG